MAQFFLSSSLLLALLNPFMLVVYLIAPMQSLTRREFLSVMVRAGLIASVVFCVFAILGDAIFSDVIQAQFASFQIFGGVIFLVIGLQFVFKGPVALEILRGESKHIAGAVAMPVLIGPGTLSASIIVGQHLTRLLACAAVLLAVFISIATVLLLKNLYDYVLPRRALLVERYIEITGRITALYIGTVAVEMIMQGIKAWLKQL
ncbi:MAG: MarC family protein [Planctomycetota bacterium]